MRKHYHRKPSRHKSWEPKKIYRKQKGSAIQDIIIVIGILVLIGIVVYSFIPSVAPFLSTLIGTTTNSIIKTTNDIPNTVNPVTDTIKSVVSPPTYTTLNESKNDVNYINRIRSSNGVNPIRFDQRVYNLALARVNDMDQYRLF